jgi:multiple sugar transport system permease protein
MKKNNHVPYVMLSPFIVLYSIFFLFTLSYAFYMSLLGGRTGHTHFVGLSNYIMAFHDTVFWESLGIVVGFAFLQAFSVLFLGLILALFLDSPYVKGKGFFRLVYFIPYAVPGVIAAIMWGFLYSPVLNPFLDFITQLRGGIRFEPLATKNLIYGILNIVVWQWTGYNMTLYYAGLTAIPLEIYDAAKIDGCSEFQIAVKIKVPLLRPMIVFTSLLSVIGALQLFNEPLLLSGLTAVPSNYTPNLYIYYMAFKFGNFNYSATLSFFLAFITLIATMLVLYFTGDTFRQKRSLVRMQKRGV